MTAKSDHAGHDKVPAAPKSGHEPKAKSAGGQPDETPTRVHHAPKISREDEPKGQPNSDRFRTEQAARPAEGKR